MPTFNCHFTALTFGPGHDQPKQISRRFSVEAPDQYDAIDIIVGKIGDEYHEMACPCFKFGRTRGLKMSQQLRATIQGVGAEEE